MINLLKDKKKFILILSISFLFFFLKWALSFYFFYSNDLTIKIIDESSSSFASGDSYTYFHYIKSLSTFNFKALYSPELSTDYFLLIPYGSIIFHSIFYKLIGDLSFILLEFIAINIFILVFYSIFRLINFPKNSAILLSVLLYIIPETLSFFNNFGIIELNTFARNFYVLRFPRPFISNLLFFIFIYTLVKSHLSNSIFSSKNLFVLALIFGLSLSSFFFVFLTQAITFILYLIISYKKKVFKFININIKKILYSSVIFLLITLPFFFLVFNTNPDYSERMGIMNISFSDKVFLLKHYLYKLFRIKLIIIYIFLFLSYFFMKKFNYINLKYIHIFYILFISSLISPLIFILFSNKVAFLYHFNNTVVVCLGLLVLMLILINLNTLFNRVNLNLDNKFFCFSSIFLILFLYNINIYINYKDNINSKLKFDRNQIINLLLNNNSVNIQNSKILSFDKKIMAWSVLKGNRDLYVIDGTFTIRDNITIENDLIDAFKFLQLSKKDFANFIANRKKGYRYNNPDLKNFFWQKYTANSLYRFKQSKDFESESLDFILNSSPFYVHQFAIPKFEIKRLLSKFEAEEIPRKQDPHIIVIEKHHKIFSKVTINQNNYCKKFSGKLLDLYIAKNFCD